ncbi:MAG: PAS domain S-box protein, partial [Acidimicrobiales bacterium]|nr:PAS domain S-box protein [Acidimicrobiales bacterium]
MAHTAYEHDAAAAPPKGGMTPSFVAYAVGPLALVLLVGCRHFGLVADAPPWAYAAAIAWAHLSGRVVERWPSAPRGSWRLHVRVVVHVSAVTIVIYMSGWGPALGMAFAFSALADLQQSGAVAWRAALAWSWLGCAVGQGLVALGWAPSFLSPTQSQTIGLLGAFVFGIAIRMAGAIAEHQERADALLAEEMQRAALARDDAQQSRDAARRSEAHHRSVVENAAEGILTFGLDGTLGSFNAAAEVMFGWSAVEIVGLSVTTIVPEELHGPLGDFLASYAVDGQAATQRNDVEIEGVRRDGTHFPMMVSTTAV